MFIKNLKWKKEYNRCGILFYSLCAFNFSKDQIMWPFWKITFERFTLHKIKYDNTYTHYTLQLCSLFLFTTLPNSVFPLITDYFHSVLLRFTQLWSHHQWHGKSIIWQIQCQCEWLSLKKACILCQFEDVSILTQRWGF